MFYSEQKKQFKILNRRTFFLLTIKTGLFSIIGWRLFNIQITNSKKYETLSKNNQINIEIIYPVRGIITDRLGEIIATNVKVFDLGYGPFTACFSIISDYTKIIPLLNILLIIFSISLDKILNLFIKTDLKTIYPIAIFFIAKKIK